MIQKLDKFPFRNSKRRRISSSPRGLLSVAFVSLCSFEYCQPYDSSSKVVKGTVPLYTRTAYTHLRQSALSARCSYFALFFLIARFYPCGTKITIVRSIVLSYLYYTQLVILRYQCERQQADLSYLSRLSLHYASNSLALFLASLISRAN